ncbi:hypothetical protein E2C01_013176 [Portunus trituberculatus]|uniref:Uncharacterized protein n=1 Tax=Portunus trituberculatus TaxID=210409 RepID=A0A5B7DFI8_PORTR|nr:hypothetical protein [Portunus trituberculatus]
MKRWSVEWMDGVRTFAEDMSGEVECKVEGCGNVENTGRREVILMRCRGGEVLGEVDPTVVQEALCSLVEALNLDCLPESRELV